MVYMPIWPLYTLVRERDDKTSAKFECYMKKAWYIFAELDTTITMLVVLQVNQHQLGTTYGSDNLLDENVIYDKCIIAPNLLKCVQP